MDAALKTLLDERAIIAVGLRYAAAIDQRDFKKFMTCFTPDAVYGLAAHPSKGHAQIESTAREGLKLLDATQHVTTNFEVTVDGDRARMRSYYVATHCRGSEQPYVIGGVYDDEFTRADGEWRIAKRILSNFWASGDPALLGPAFAKRINLPG